MNNLREEEKAMVRCMLKRYTVGYYEEGLMDFYNLWCDRMPYLNHEGVMSEYILQRYLIITNQGGN